MLHTGDVDIVVDAHYGFGRVAELPAGAVGVALGGEFGAVGRKDVKIQEKGIVRDSVVAAGIGAGDDEGERGGMRLCESNGDMDDGIARGGIVEEVRERLIR